MDKALARRWAAGHAAAHARALEVMRAEGPRSPEDSFARSMELVDLAPEHDEFRERDVAPARAAWVKLKAWAASRAKR